MHRGLPNLKPKSLLYVAKRTVLSPLFILYDYVQLYRSSRGPRKRSKSIQKDIARDAPKPLRLKRRRAPSSSRVNVNASVDCPLLNRLPEEIRIEIWQYVLGSGGHYHLMHGGGRITHALCQFSNHENVNNLASPCCASSASRTCCDKTFMSHTCLSDGSEGRCIRQSMNVQNLRNNFPRVDLNLLRTCRQIYQEVALLLYSTNIFDVDDLNTLIYWSRTILPSRLATVRALSISWDVFWPPLTKTDPADIHTFETACRYERLRLRHSDQVWVEFWEVVATKMTGLQDLRMRIGFMPAYYAVVDLDALFGKDRGLVRDVSAQWVEPILSIRGLKKFELEIFGGYSQGPSDRFDPPGRGIDLEVQERTKLFLEDVRRIVCEPLPR
jgi:hypothetical protein